MTRIHQDYSYAYNSSGELIKANNASKSDVYTCPCCGDVMIPHQGQVRRHHFKHKAGANCNYETYLHKLAKLRIREAYLNSEEFTICYNQPYECSIDCSLSLEHKCVRYAYNQYNLHDFYDSCHEEETFENFRPDLILTSSKNIFQDPVLIEIYVTHKCSEDKLKSGHRIIEIHIESENDIDLIVDNLVLKGTNHSLRNINDKDKISFYNFNKKASVEPNVRFHKLIHVFAATNYGVFTATDFYCFEDIAATFPHNIYNLIVSNVPIDTLWALSELERHGLNIKDCVRCVYIKKDRCIKGLWDTPVNPLGREAQTCKYYRVAVRDEYNILIDSSSPILMGHIYISEEPFYNVLMSKPDK